MRDNYTKAKVKRKKAKRRTRDSAPLILLYCRRKLLFPFAFLLSPFLVEPLLNQQLGEFGDDLPGDLAHDLVGHQLDDAAGDCVNVLARELSGARRFFHTR